MACLSSGACRNEGIIDQEGAKVRIRDLARLQDAAGGCPEVLGEAVPRSGQGALETLAYRDHAHPLMSDRSSRSREGEARDRIRRAAYELFAERGYHGASVREIARRAGMSQGQITYHFGSKAALFRTVATDASDVLDTVARDAAIAADATRRLTTLTERVAERTEARQAFGILVAGMFARELAPSVLPHPLDWIRAVTAPDPTAVDGRSPGA